MDMDDEKKISKLRPPGSPLEAFAKNFKYSQQSILRGLKIFDYQQYLEMKPITPEFFLEDLVADDDIIELGDSLCFIDAFEFELFLDMWEAVISSFTFSDTSSVHSRSNPSCNILCLLDNYDPKKIGTSQDTVAFIFEGFLAMYRKIYELLCNTQFCADICKTILEFTLGWEDALVVDHTPGITPPIQSFTGFSSLTELKLQIGIFQYSRTQYLFGRYEYAFGALPMISVSTGQRVFVNSGVSKTKAPCLLCGTFTFRLPRIVNHEDGCCTKHSSYRLRICLDCYTDLARVPCLRHFPHNPCFQCRVDAGGMCPPLCERAVQQIKARNNPCQLENNMFNFVPYEDKKKDFYVSHYITSQTKQPETATILYKLAKLLFTIKQVPNSSTQYNQIPKTSTPIVYCLQNSENQQDEDIILTFYKSVTSKMKESIKTHMFWSKQVLPINISNIEIEKSITKLGKYRMAFLETVESIIENKTIARILWDFAELPLVQYTNDGQLFKFQTNSKYELDGYMKTQRPIKACAQCHEHKVLSQHFVCKNDHFFCKDCWKNRFRCCSPRCQRKLCFLCSKESGMSKPYRYVLCKTCCTKMYRKAPYLLGYEQDDSDSEYDSSCSDCSSD